tara:strand:- start:891 stop:1457 length:567 start_codon:yes stop_codon:yes gene_type:complete
MLTVSRSKIILSDEESDDELEIVPTDAIKASQQVQIVDTPSKNVKAREVAIENSPLNARNVKKGGRLSKGKKVVAKKKDVVVMEEEEVEDDEEQDEYDEDGTDVLRKCESLSSKLLDSLRRWIAPASSDRSAAEQEQQSLENCDSIKIAAVDSTQGNEDGMITMELMNTISRVPLKNYQMLVALWVEV